MKKILHGARTIGVANSIRALRFARYRDRLDAKHIPAISETPVIKPGKLIACVEVANGADFKFEKTTLEIRFLGDNLIFIAWEGAKMTPSFAIEKTEWSDVKVQITEDENSWFLQSDKVMVKVSGDGSLSLLDLAGGLLRWETPPQWEGHAWSHKTALNPEACIYGLGERSSRLNLRPGKYRFWNIDAGGTYSPGDDPLYICMPVYMCIHEVGSTLIFYDNTFDGQISFGEQATINFQDGPARYYLAVGKPTELLTRFTELTGRAPMPPRWALGYQQSKWGYRTQAEMRRIFKLFQHHDLPLSVLTLDGDHLRGYRTLTVDEDRYPNLTGFATELRDADVHLVASTNPGIKIERGFDLYEAGLKENVYCKTPEGEVMKGVVWPGWTAFIDTTNPQVRAWWGQQYTRHLDHGVEGFWHDMNEPATFAAWGDRSFPLCTRHDMDGCGGDHREVHNIYGALMNKAGYNGLRAQQPDKRPFILSRSGWVGMQRHAWCWTGDVETSWAALRQTAACVLGLGVSGMPYSGPDIGGFTGAPSPELFVRWFQLASFLPFFRTHCIFYLPNREPWEFGEEVLGILRQQLKQRYRLLPHWYTLAWQTSQTGQPLVRPLFWSDPHDQHLWEIDNAFLVGEALLVAPILEEAAQQRSLYLPKGNWYKYGGEQKYNGGTEIQLEAPLEHIPVLVRAGGIIPEVEESNLVLHIYRPHLGETGAGQLFSDAGNGFGENRLDQFTLSPELEQGYVLSWTAQGEYPFPYEKMVIKLHGFEGKPLADIQADSPDLGDLIEIDSD
ncbi:MAG: glycoside hydrolase family 31 protein [Anaerolineales bacterium]|nr:glycoside hydrolase family 31 protein [Anaerolineales bacterium]